MEEKLADRDEGGDEVNAETTVGAAPCSVGSEDLLRESRPSTRRSQMIAVATADTVDLGFPPKLPAHAVMEVRPRSGADRGLDSWASTYVPCPGRRGSDVWTATARIPLLDGTDAVLPLSGSWRLTRKATPSAPRTSSTIGPRRDRRRTRSEVGPDCPRHDRQPDQCSQAALPLDVGLRARHVSRRTRETCSYGRIERRGVGGAYRSDLQERDEGSRARDWAGEKQTGYRIVLQALVAAGGHSTAADLVTATGLTRRQIHMTAEAIRKRPPLVQRRNGVLSLIPCCHCGGAASHYINTPETRDLPLICPQCRRQPDKRFANRVWDEVYLEPWEAVVVGGALVSTIVPVPPLLCDPTPFDGRILNTADTARILGVEENTVRRWVTQGTLNAVPGPGQSFWFLKEDVERLDARRRHVRDIGRHKPLAGLLSPRLAAVEIGCSIDKVRKMCKRGDLEWVPIQHGKVTIKGISPTSVAQYHRKTAVITQRRQRRSFGRASSCGRLRVLRLRSGDPM